MLLILFILDVLCGDMMLGGGVLWQKRRVGAKNMPLPLQQPVEGKLLFASVGMVP